MSTRMQQRRGTASQWTTANPTLAAGEIGFETDTNKFKIGDGVNLWEDLSYFENLASLGGSFDDYIPLNIKGEPLGVAELDADGQVPLSQLGNAITDLTGYATETYVNTAVSDIIGAAPGALDTLNELAAAIGDDANFFTTINTNITDAENAAKAYADGLAVNYDPAGAASTAETNANNYTDNAINGLGGNVTAVVNGNLDVMTGTGITVNNSSIEVDFQELGTRYDALGAADSAETSANLYTDSSITTALGTAQNYADTAEADAKSYADSLAANYDAAGVATTAVFNHSAETTNVHGIADTAALALTADVNTALDLKANLASPSLTGTTSIEDLIVSGDLTVSGTTTTVNTQDLVVTDPLIYVGEGNQTNLVDLGVVASFNDGTYQHTGLARDASDNKWKLFKGVTDEPTTTVNFAQGSLDDLAVGAISATSATIGDVSNTELQYLNGVTSSVQDQLDDKAPIASPTFTGTVSGITASMVGLGNVDNTTDANKPVSTATQNALDLKANLAGPTFSGSVSLPQTTSIGDVSATEIGYVNGVTSGIQAQLDSKASTSYVDSEIAAIDLSTKQDVVSGVTSTEIGYLDGVTSAIQTQLDAKAPTSSPQFTAPRVVSGNIKLENGSSAGIQLNNIGGDPIITQVELNTLSGIDAGAGSIQEQLDSKASGAIVDNATNSTATNSIMIGNTTPASNGLLSTDSSLTIQPEGTPGKGISFSSLFAELSPGLQRYATTAGASSTAPINETTVQIVGGTGGGIHIVELDISVWVYGDSKNSIPSGSKTWKWKGSIHVEGNANNSAADVATIIGYSITDVSETTSPSMTGFDFSVALGTDPNSGAFAGSTPLQVQFTHPSGAPSPANSIWTAAVKHVSNVWI